MLQGSKTFCENICDIFLGVVRATLVRGRTKVNLKNYINTRREPDLVRGRTGLVGYGSGSANINLTTGKTG